uniref:Chromosome 19 open reading frame 18 n=1 Tax=Oryctolagus cuniculus TaxID=9986 RepID=G1TU52_RABIT
MGKIQSSFTFLFLFLMECPLHVCLSYANGFQSVEKTTELPGQNPPQTPIPVNKQSKLNYGIIRTPRTLPRPTVGRSTQFTKFLGTRTIIPHRPALVQVILIACIAFGIAVTCGIAISYVIYRLVKAEESQQLALLYENVKISFLEEEEGSEDDARQDESTHLLPENEKELGKFIHSVIRAKRKENFEKKKLREEQKVVKDNITRKAMQNSQIGNF